jgi:hypothetical protein
MAENAVAANNWLGTAIQEGNGYSQNPVARIKEKSGLWILSRLGRTLVWEALTCMVRRWQPFLGQVCIYNWQNGRC